MSQPSNLSLALPHTTTSNEDPNSPHTPITPVDSAADAGAAVQTPVGGTQDAQDVTSLPPLPKSPSSPQVTKETSRGLFTSYRTNKLRNKSKEPTLRHVPQSLSTNHLGGSTSSIPIGDRHPYGKSHGTSSASLSHVNLLETAVEKDDRDPSSAESELKPGSAPLSEGDPAPLKTSSRHKFHGFLHRSRSIREEEGGRQKSRLRPLRTGGEPRPVTRPSADATGLRTAPLEPDRSFRDMLGSSLRNKSADRHAIESDDERPPKQSSSYNSNSGPNFFSSFVNSSSKAADGIGKAGKGIFGKLTRSGSSNERDIPDDAYQCRVITLPLVEQTRKTRVKARLQDAGDKTEFWMPALPYRCIDFLNLHGIEEEGLYRIPGSGLQVKHWQRRFDQEGDINLLNEPELYDINIIGSMFKAWLRELPDEILPRPTQAMIARECAGATETPQLMKDELSKLPPFNYYLLFAITCHISLLHEHSDKNKMNYHNLCICFQPCMKIDAFCFQFLVQDWRNCWQGCWTEKQYRDEEERILQEAGAHSTAFSSGGVGGVASDNRGQSHPPTSSAGRSVAASSVSADDHQSPSAPDSARPTIGQQRTSDRHVPQDAKSTSKNNGEAISSSKQQKQSTQSPRPSTPPQSTPPSLTPVQTVSPMRM